jgi:hypothetical protein
MLVVYQVGDTRGVQVDQSAARVEEDRLYAVQIGIQGSHLRAVFS